MPTVDIGPSVGGCDATPPGLDDYCGPTSVGGFFFGHDTVAVPPQVTPRVYLAGQALAALLQRGWIDVAGMARPYNVEDDPDLPAEDAVILADAVLARLKETE